MATIPGFDVHGNLPPGVYRVSLSEVEDRFTWNARRRQLFAGLSKALANLAAAGVKRVWIDGSFATAKEEPNDVGGCWELEESLEAGKLDMVFLFMEPPRIPMRRKYGVDFLIAGSKLGDPGFEGRRVEELFQEDAEGNPKGILLIDTSDEP